jgi:hypothetical protein
MISIQRTEKNTTPTNHRRQKSGSRGSRVAPVGNPNMRIKKGRGFKAAGAPAALVSGGY